MMLAKLIESELSDSWEYIEDSDESDAEGIGARTDGPVALHESGSELFVSKFDTMWVANVTQPVELDGVRAEPVTRSSNFVDKQELANYLNEVCDDIDAGAEATEAFAMVPHMGSINSVQSEDLSLANVDVDDVAFADVFVVHPEHLPDGVSAESFTDVRREIVDFVYGESTEVPESMQELNKESEAYGSATIGVFTVSAQDGLFEVDEQAEDTDG